VNDEANIIECPSGLRVRVKKLKARQFKLLGNRKALETGDAFEQFLMACATEVIDPGPAYPGHTIGTVFDWKKALQGDRFAALLGIRSVTHVGDFEFDVKCSACGEEYGWALPLSKLARVAYPKSSIAAFAEKRELSVKVDSDDGIVREVFFRLMTGAEEERVRNHIDKLAKTDKRTRKHPFDPIVDGVLARISKVVPAPADLREWYEDLDASEVLKIGNAFERTAGGIDTTITTEHTDDPRCPGGTTKVELPFGAKDFWIPRGKGMGTADDETTTD
jgi:hypothetical protein